MRPFFFPMPSVVVRGLIKRLAQKSRWIFVYHLVCAQQCFRWQALSHSYYSRGLRGQKPKEASSNKHAGVNGVTAFVSGQRKHHVFCKLPCSMNYHVSKGSDKRGRILSEIRTFSTTCRHFTPRVMVLSTALKRSSNSPRWRLSHR